MTGTFSSVPIVDFARLSDTVTKNEELSKLREAIFVVGFLYLTNTGLEVRAARLTTRVTGY
jgi:isopenicillin N synthase-like dioxygenase